MNIQKLKEVIKKLGLEDELDFCRFCLCTNKKKKDQVLVLLKDGVNSEYSEREINFFVIRNLENPELIKVGGLDYEASKYSSQDTWLTTVWITNEDYRGYGIASQGLHFLEEQSEAIYHRKHIDGEFRPTGLGAGKMYKRNGYSICNLDCPSTIYKNINLEEIHKNTNEVDGIKIYNDFKYWRLLNIKKIILLICNVLTLRGFVIN